MSNFCDFCNKSFATKSNLKYHQKVAKYCLELQGKKEVAKVHHCTFCSKEFLNIYTLQDHNLICKEKKKIDQENKASFYEKEISKLEKKMERQKREYVEKLERQEEKMKKQQESYEEKMKKQQESYEEKMEKQQNIINTIAMRPSTTNNKNTIIHNNQKILNFNDKEKLNDVIRKKVTQSVVQKGQIGLAGVVFDNYLTDQEGNRLYQVTDTSRQNFDYYDENGELRVDIGEKKLTEAISKSNLTQHVALIAKDIPNLYDKETGYLEEVVQLTNFDEDHSKFRKEIVRLAKTSS